MPSARLGMGHRSLDRFFVCPGDVSGDVVRLGSGQAHQVREVLRLRPGDMIAVLDNTGWEATVVLQLVEKGLVQGMVVERHKVTTEPAVDLTLYQALVPRTKFELVLQKCTEVGVSRFVPLVADRSIARDVGSKLDRWRRIVLEAAEQSGRGLIPLVEGPKESDVVLGRSEGQGLRLLAVAGQEGEALHGVLASGRPIRSVELCIGPEGGFTCRELERARQGGWRWVSLGRRVLRTETAAIVASALVLYELGQMEP